MPMPPLHLIQTFIIAAAVRSFTKAAIRLEVSSMAVSKQIKQLENVLGVTLFNRTTRKVVLTDIGESLFSQYVDILNSLEEVTRFVNTQKKTYKGTLKVISTFSIGEFFLMPYLAEFLNKYPDIILHLDMVDRVPDLFDENIDIAFGFPLESIGSQCKDLRHSKLMSFYRKLYASSSYLEQYGYPKNLKACYHHNYIFNSRRTNDEFMKACQKHHIKLRSIITTNSITAMIQGCQSGLGLVSLSEFIVAKMPSHQKLIEIDNLVSPTFVEVYLYYKNLRYIDPKIICFKNFFKQKIQTTHLFSNKLNPA